MAHPQHNFTSNFNGSEGHNAELTLNINGVEKKYTPAGNDQTYNVPGVAHIDVNLDGDDLVEAIQTALSGDAQPVLVERSIYDEEVAYPYIGDLEGSWYFGVCTIHKIVTIAVAKEDGAVNVEQIPVTKGVAIVPSDSLNIYSQLRIAIALGQLPVLHYVGANPVYAQYEKTADNGDMVFVGAFATKSTSSRIQCVIYKIASDNTITTETYASFSGAYNDLTGKPDIKKGRLHRIGVRLVQESDPSPKPMTDWVIDLESPNSEEPDGYDRLTVARAKEIHENGEVFAFTSYSTGGLVNNKDTYYESIFNSSSSYLNIVLTKASNHQNPAEISRAMISDYGDYAGVMDASADSEYLNVTLVQEDSDPLRENKIHRYSFGDGIVDGETPIYGSWLIDLDKPDPDGPEGYARVTPAEFWKATAVNGEVPVYLQDKNANNSLTYAYLSRTDVTKSGDAVTSVFAYFVRSGYGNNLSGSNGFRFSKLPGSDYLQKAASSDDSFTALSSTGNSGTTKPTFTTAQAVANIVSGESLNTMLGKIAKWFSAGFPMKDYGTKTIDQMNINVDNNGYTKIVNPNSVGIVYVIINPVTDGEVPNVEVDIDNSESTSNTGVTVQIHSGGAYTTLRNTTDTTPIVSSGKIMHISAHGMGWRGTILAT